jgi:HEAT repeat protein
LNKANTSDQRVEGLLAGSTRPLSEEEVASAIAVIRDPGEDAVLRASTFRVVCRELGYQEESIDLLLQLLKDPAQPREVRIAALQAMQMLAFVSPLFMTKRPDFLAALRSIVDDPDTVVRQAAIEVLSLEKDEYVQRRLNEGLDDPSKALVSPEKAIQLLGQDVHAELYPRLRAIVQNPPNAAAREEAVRLMAGDPESGPLLASLMTDKAEDVKIRTLSAVSLRVLDPDGFTEQAKQIVLDNTEQDALRLTGLNGLTHFEETPSLIGADPVFEQGLQELMASSPSSELREAAARYFERKR